MKMHKEIFYGFTWISRLFFYYLAGRGHAPYFLER